MPMTIHLWTDADLGLCNDAGKAAAVPFDAAKLQILS